MINNPIQEIISSTYGNDFSHLTYPQQKTVNDICQCRTPALGGTRYFCNDCGHTRYVFRSCGNRSCPCQAFKQAKWVDARSAEVVDVTYYHAVFTVPCTLNDVIYHHQRECYDLLFQAVSKTLLEMGADKRHMNAKLGFMCFLHTWGSTILYHPHMHVILLGCGLSKSGKLVYPKGKGNYMLPVKAMSRLFRGKFLDGLKKFNFSESVDYTDLYSKDWVVYMKDSVSGPDHVIEYLGRYTTRIAISNSRIVSHTSEEVTFSYKDYRDNCTKKTMSLSSQEFSRRFMMHVLPRGFRKIRFYGFLSNRSKEASLCMIRNLLKCEKREASLKDKSAAQIMLIKYGHDCSKCSNCGSSNISITNVLPDTRFWSSA